MSNLKRKKIKVLGFVIAFFFVIIVVIISYLMWNRQRKEDTLQNEKQIESEKHSIMNPKVFDGAITKDLRLHYYNCIQLNNKLAVGDYVDIRISFPNGLDFIILPKKEIVDRSVESISENRTESTMWMYVSEREILRMSSAIVDQNTMVGTVIYAVKYVETSQESAFANYPVSDIVKRLIENCPNILYKDKLVSESPLRKEIEENSERIYDSFVSTADEENINRKETQDIIANGNTLNQDEIIYFD